MASVQPRGRAAVGVSASWRHAQEHRGAAWPCAGSGHAGDPCLPRGLGGAIMDPDGPMAGIIPPLTPRDGEAVIAKQLPNSSAGTKLDADLKRLGRMGLLVVGFMTHMCVSATMRAAMVTVARWRPRPAPVAICPTVAAGGASGGGAPCGTGGVGRPLRRGRDECGGDSRARLWARGPHRRDQSRALRARGCFVGREPVHVVAVPTGWAARRWAGARLTSSCGRRCRYRPMR